MVNLLWLRRLPDGTALVRPAGVTGRRVVRTDAGWAADLSSCSAVLRVGVPQQIGDSQRG